MKYDISKFTKEEKLHLLSGNNFWELYKANGKLPAVFLSDGPHGLRKENEDRKQGVKATAMPNLSLIACSWDEDVAYLQGKTIADDFIENNTCILLAPGVNIKRTPLCGRNFEYFSEDPYLSGYLAKAMIEGLQQQGIGTSLKHYCCNNREYDRLFQSSEVDERTLREIYLAPFEIALEARPWTVMCAYNPINGIWASENRWLLKDILRDEFKFDGVIVSDWGAVRHRGKSLKATLDLAMPKEDRFYTELKESLDSGLISMDNVDKSVERMLALIEKTQCDKKISFSKEQRHINAVNIAKESMVLLKNEDNILPLKGKNILLAGCYDGIGGGGSAYVESDFVPKTLEEELSSRIKDVNIQKAPMYIDSRPVVIATKAIYHLAYQSDTIILTFSTGKEKEGEGFDRMDLKLSPVFEDIILNTAKINKNIIVIIQSGSAIDVSNWIDKVKGLVYAGFAGEGAQEAIADILCGISCPSGKLTETWPVSLEDSPTKTYRGDGFTDRYQEGIFVGYRYYDTFNKDVQFPFGFGLSYANFEYSNMNINKIKEDEYDVSFDITNTSSIPGKEIAQVYIKDVFSAVSRPEKELKGYKKISLNSGETKKVTIHLDYRSFAFYSIPLHKWHIENGTFEVLVGSSSRNIKLKDKIEINLDDDQYTLW